MFNLGSHLVHTLPTYTSIELGEEKEIETKLSIATTKYEDYKGTWTNAANPPTTSGIAIDGITIQYTYVYLLLAMTMPQFN